jgi:hypothetical protein
MNGKLKYTAPPDKGRPPPRQSIGPHESIEFPTTVSRRGNEAGLAAVTLYRFDMIRCIL